MTVYRQWRDFEIICAHQASRKEDGRAKFSILQEYDQLCVPYLMRDDAGTL